MVRDPLNVLPSGLSLVTGVLDKRFGFWSLDENIRERFIKRLYNAFVECNVKNKPKVVIAHTIKGKGVSFMENNNEWHHNRLTEVNYKQALKEIGEI